MSPICTSCFVCVIVPHLYILFCLCHCPPCTCPILSVSMSNLYLSYFACVSVHPVHVLFCPPYIHPVLSVSLSILYMSCFVCVTVHPVHVLFCLCQCPPCTCPILSPIYTSCFACVSVHPVHVLFCLCHCPPSIHPVSSVSASTVCMSCFLSLSTLNMCLPAVVVVSGLTAASHQKTWWSNCAGSWSAVWSVTEKNAARWWSCSNTTNACNRTWQTCGSSWVMHSTLCTQCR